MRNNNSFVFYESFWKNYCRIKEKDPVAALETMEAIVKFGLYGETPSEDSPIWLYGLEQSFTSIEAAQDRRQKAVSNGQRGGRPACVLDKEEVYSLKKELKTWKAVAEKLGVDEKTLRTYRKKWEEEENGKNGKTETFSRLPILEEEKQEKPEKANVNPSSSFLFESSLDTKKQEKPEKANVNEKIFLPFFELEENGKNGKTETFSRLPILEEEKQEKPEKPEVFPVAQAREELVSQQPTTLSIPAYLNLTDWRAQISMICKGLSDWEKDALRAELERLPQNKQSSPCWIFCALKKMKIAPGRVKDNAYRLNYPDFQREVDAMVDCERAELEERIHKQEEITKTMRKDEPETKVIIIPRIEKEKPKEIYNIEEW